MFVFIDESGCSGFKFSRGSSEYFIVSMVIIDKPENAERISAKINALRPKLHHKTEFKFSDSSNAVKDGFFEAISKEPFKVRAIIINKPRIYSPNLRANKEKFYNYFVKSLLEHDNDILNQASIFIDGSGDRAFKQELNTYLRKQLKGRKIKKFKFADSKRNNLIQLADMAAGAIARAYNRADKKDASKWLNIIKPKINDLWEFK